ncbi:MAG TPA: Gfo/Idh/MocA family oxidoreductase, partial [Phycisphaerae bacterium]|nr:Gfo/Idh/MocA family oxidoreductase [Phycisphaerae bacterium]
KTVTDFREMLDDIDAVIISSPNGLHPAQAIACAEAGKHIWIEKPMALSTADADRICKAVDTAGVKSFVGFSIRFGAAPRTIKNEFTNGAIGSLRSIFSRRCSHNFKNGMTGWRADFAKTGGVLAELLAHEIDWMIDIAGDPISIYCRIMADNHSDPRENDHVWITMGFADGATGTIEGTHNAMIADFYKGIIGSAGSLTDRNWGSEVYLQDRDGDRKLELTESFNKHSHFLDVIEGKAESVADVHLGRKVVYISEKALDSAISGKVLAL